MNQFEEVREHYNAVAADLGLPKCRGITPARRAQISRRIAETSLEEMHEAIDKLRNSSFCQGANDREWRANFDFVLQASSYMKLLEGVYDDAAGVRKLSNFERAMADVDQGLGSETSSELNRLLSIDGNAE